MKKIFASLVISSALVLSGCSGFSQTPATGSEMREALDSIERPSTLAKFSLVTDEEFRSSYSETESYSATFASVSEECQAVSDIERVARFAQGGSRYIDFLPPLLNDFQRFDGLHYQLITPDGADQYSYASVQLAVLAFEDQEGADEFVEVLRKNVEVCFDFDDEKISVPGTDAGLVYSARLDEFLDKEAEGLEYSWEKEMVIDWPDGGLIGLALENVETITEHFVEISSFGPNVYIRQLIVDSKSDRALGYSLEDLDDYSEGLIQQLKDAISESQE